MTGTQGLPARRLGSRITINDSETMSAARDAYIIGIQWAYAQTGYTQDLEAVDSAGVYKYTLAQYFVIGTDTLGSSKKVFY